jgi:hypothetical protein
MRRLRAGDRIFARVREIGSGCGLQESTMLSLAGIVLWFAASCWIIDSTCDLP